MQIKTMMDKIKFLNCEFGIDFDLEEIVKLHY